MKVIETWWPLKHKEHHDVKWVQLREDLQVYIAISGSEDGFTKYPGKKWNISRSADTFLFDDIFCEDELELRAQLMHVANNWGPT